MNTLWGSVAAAFLVTSAAFAQDKPPAAPSGTMRVEADHREFASRVRTTEWRVPSGAMEGFTTYFPDGLYIVTVKLKDGAVVHNAGSYRIDGDVWCQKARMPADSKEACFLNYRTGENAFESWNREGTFAVFWNYRVKK